MRRFTLPFSRVWTVRDGAAYDGDHSLVSLRKGYQETLCSQPLGEVTPSAITTIGFFKSPRQLLGLNHHSVNLTLGIPPSGYRASGCSGELVTLADHSTNRPITMKLTCTPSSS